LIPGVGFEEEQVWLRNSVSKSPCSALRVASSPKKLKFTIAREQGEGRWITLIRNMSGGVLSLDQLSELLLPRYRKQAAQPPAFGPKVTR